MKWKWFLARILHQNREEPLMKWMGTDKAGFGGQTFILGHPV